MLEVIHLNQAYGESHTLRDVSLSVPSGQCLSVIGRNGVGKTTLLKTLMGLLKPKSGRIVFDGHDLIREPVDARARLGIGYVPQGRQIFGQLTVAENLRIGLTTVQRHRAVPDAVFRWFPALKELLHRRGGDLSGGQQQQLAIGRALTLNPKLLILDEPTEGIQPNIVQQIGVVLEELAREQGLAILLVEQKLAFVRKFAQRFCVMDRGQTVAQGAIEALDDKLVQQYLTV